MKHTLYKSITAVMLGLQIMQSVGFASYTSINQLGDRYSQEEIIAHQGTIDYYEQVMRDEMASVLTRWSKKHLNRYEAIQQCRYRDIVRAEHRYQQDIKDGCAIGILTKRTRFQPRSRATQSDVVTALARAIEHNSTISRQEAYTILQDKGIIDSSFIGHHRDGFTRYWLYDILDRADSSLGTITELAHTESSWYPQTDISPEMADLQEDLWGWASTQSNDTTTSHLPSKPENNDENTNTSSSWTRNDVDVYDDTPDALANGNSFLRKDENKVDKPTTDTTTQTKPAPVKPAPINTSKLPTPQITQGNNDVDVYDDTPDLLANGNSFLRKDENKVDKPATTKSQPTAPTPTTPKIIKPLPVQQVKPTTGQTASVITTTKNTVYSPVVQVRAYSYNNLFKSYQVVGMGSAVVISPTQAITNAHVALSEDNKPYYLELCVTYSPDESPLCTMSAKVVRYNNTSTDLALLEFASNPLIKPTTLGTNPTIGDSVLVHGYPINGGNTITISQGIVSGRNGNDYKIDATINHGNSGGGAFNKSGALVGIPSYGVGDLETIGYIISVDTVKKFLDKTLSSTAVVTDQYDNFAQFITQQQSIIGSTTIKTAGYSATANASTTIKYGVEHKGQGISLYYLENSKNQTHMIVRSQRIIDGTINNKAMQNIIDNIVPWETGKYTTGSTTINGITWTKLSPTSSDALGVAYVAVHKQQVISVLSLNKDGNTSDVSDLIKSVTFSSITLDPITTLLPQIKLSANNNLIPVLGYGLATFAPERGLYSSINDGSVAFSVDQSPKKTHDNNDSSDIEALFEGGDAQIYTNKVGQRILVMKKTSSVFSVGLIGASSDIGNDERVFVSLIFYDRKSYPILNQLIGWLDTLSLGGTDSMGEATTTSVPSRYFEDSSK